ncbi:hypothetical protein pclt_cds_637 [Pandoravirus celtis]|uniref:DUF5867 domain-containing protein n=1 Tax=Pandoravirus celtis TaxID=2568002 RepID=A0A4D6EJ59_9VIRU|nr:hypothetical protein pclt_cds_637 [Pandoravirus celtis]
MSSYLKTNPCRPITLFGKIKSATGKIQGQKTLLPCSTQQHMDHIPKNLSFTPTTRDGVVYATVKGLRVAAPIRLPATCDAQSPTPAKAVGLGEVPSTDDAAGAPCDQPYAIHLNSTGQSLLDLINATVLQRDLTIDARLCRAEQAVEAAEQIFGLATADGQPRPVPNSLIKVLWTRSPMNALRFMLVDSALLGGDAAANRCLDVALRTEALARSYSQLTEDVRTRPSLCPVTGWLLDGVDWVPSATVPTPADAQTVVRVAATDAWMPVFDIARAAGRACSAMLLQRTHVEARRRAEQGTRVTTKRNVLPSSTCSTSLPLQDYMAIAMLALKAFVRGLSDPVAALCSSSAACHWMALCRGPARVIVRTLRAAIETARAAEWSVPAPKPIHSARKTLAVAIDVAGGSRRDALVYMLGLLTSVAVVCTGRGKMEDDMPLQKMAMELQDPACPSRDIAIEGLDIIGDDNDDTIVGAAEPDTLCDPINGKPPHPQDDLLSNLWGHHPDLFVAVLAHADPWDIGSLALTSRTHYAHVVKAVREDDAAESGRRFRAMGLSGTLWLQQRLDRRTYDAVAQLITPPPPDRGTLPDLRLLLFLCRPMATLDMVGLRRQRRRSKAALRMACALHCGDAIVRCINWLGLDQHPVQPKQDMLRDRHQVKWLAKEAGRSLSPLLMRIAISESRRALSRTEQHYPFNVVLWERIDHIDSLVRGMVAATAETLRGDILLHRQRHHGDLTRLVDMICTFLTGVRREMDNGCMGPMGNDRLAGVFRGAAMAVLAPGIRLPMPRTRTRLALALLEAARPVWLGQRPNVFE